MGCRDAGEAEGGAVGPMILSRFRRRSGPTPEARDAAFRRNSRARAERYDVPHVEITRVQVWEASAGRCYLCGRAWAPGAEWQPEHVVPVSRGGAHILANLRVSCPTCNRAKGAKVKPPPPHIRRAAMIVARTASARLSGDWRQVRCKPAHIIRAPQCWTVRLACDPRDVPALLHPNTAEVVTAALGLRAPVAIVREGAHVAVQVPFERPATVALASMPCEAGRVGLGIDTGGRVVKVDLANPNTAHTLVAGGTGSGKTTLARGVLAKLVLANGPDRLRVVGIDVKRELFTGPLANVPHLLYRVATTPEDGAALVAWVKGEIDRRMGAGGQTRPRIVLAIDEAWSIDAADLEAIARLGRSLGVHLLAMTQRGVSGDMAKSVLTQFGVRVCGLLGPDDQWTAKNMGVEAIYRALLWSGDFAATIAGDREPRRFQGAYAPAADPFWSAGWPDPVDPPAIPGRAGKAAAVAKTPGLTDAEIVARMRAEYRGPMTGRAVRLWTVACGLLGHDHEGRPVGVGSERAARIAAMLTGTDTAGQSPASA